MKILILANSPTVKTGYGVQCGLLVDRLVEDGHDVAIAATFGQAYSTGIGTYTARNGTHVNVYPIWNRVCGDDIVFAHAKAHFGTEEGWILTLQDVWSMTDPEWVNVNAVAWTPIDHDPAPPIVTRFFEFSKARPLAMSRHGQKALTEAGYEADYIPLAVDCNVYKPTFAVDVVDRGEMTGRQYFNLPDRAFVVGMVSHNKDPNDRKGFAEAFAAFARFQKNHPDAILHVHSDPKGTHGGLNLIQLATALDIPERAISYTAEYQYVTGFDPVVMALLYTSFDVLLAPSAGEGFCVPLIEAQACGVPVIASDFTAQPELVGAGWTVEGQRWWDPANAAWYIRPNVDDIVGALEAAYGSDLVEMMKPAREFAKQYDADYVYDTYWRPYLKTLDLAPPAVKPPMNRPLVVVPAMKRPENVERLTTSFDEHTHGLADLVYVLDEDDAEQIAAVEAARAWWIPAKRGTSFASKVNAAHEHITANNWQHDWLFICGDDVEFTEGWLEAARELSDRYDVIGTNDSEPGRVRNPKVANGTHADHFFIRRSYVDEEGGSLEGPGIVLAEAYYHFYTDMETIQLAKARGVFAPCLESRVIHHHPGYDGREDLRAADPVYMKAVEFSEMDSIAFKRRAGLIDQHKVVKKDIWR